MSSVTTFLWFDKGAEDAAEFYVSVVPNSRILDVQRDPDSNALAVRFTLDGQQFAALNGNPNFQPNDFASIYLERSTQEEIDTTWEALLDGGTPTACGWLRDRYGVSWQVIPAELPGLLSDPDPAKARAATEAMLAMQKIDIDKIKEAHAAA
ncbi:VOC family protein [Thermocrispum municipale]|jgi:predicted 3-demethylubiquinone-9 3-methyltransferase (glyoxalase superfamily)|uniref:VOC family protein n=1 Tax=Thermocrispum municipale TaxID=37926 RepID=UPI00040A9B80|nr:VOC family protein [Thermocrispum municipale]